MGTRSARGPRQTGREAQEAGILDSWVRAHAEELYRFAYRACGDSATAEDLVQETFHEAWKHRGPLGEIREPRAWLFLILRRRHARLRRSEQRRPWIVSLGNAGVDGGRTAGGDDGPMGADELQHALDGMGDLLKMPLLMVFVQGMTCAQAAEHLDVPLGTVLSRIHRAKKHLRETVRNHDQAGRIAGGSSDADDRPPLRIGGVQ